MTINERVSPERLAHIRASYEASRKGYAFIGHPSYNESIAIIDELQQYRAAAEPDRNPVLGYADNYRDMAKRGVESVPIWSVITDLERNIAPLFAAPQVTSVPDKIEPTHEAIKAILPTACPDEYACCVGADMWNACRAAMLSGGTLISEGTTAAPAVQAEQLSGNTEQVSQPALPEGYALVPSKLTADNGAKGLLSGEFSETKYINCPECFGDDECETCDGSGRIEITVPVSWTTIKEIWAKGVEHFAAAPQQEAQEVKK